MSSKPNLEGGRVLLTGGAGFIGSHLVDGLLAQGARVRVLDDFSTGRRENLADLATRIEVVEGDIRSLSTCQRAMAGMDFLLHQAALSSVPRSLESPADAIAINVGGTANLFQAARDAQVRRVVYASSASVYGDEAPQPNHEGLESTPVSPYAQSKAMVEQVAACFGEAFGLVSVGLRYFNVYGPRQNPAGAYASVIPRFFAARQAGRSPVLYGSGNQSRDFIYVGDVVRANLLALTEPMSRSARYNVGTGIRTSVRDLAKRIDSLMPKGPPLTYEPARAGEVQHSSADMIRCRRELNFEAMTSLQEGLERTAAEYHS